MFYESFFYRMHVFHPCLAENMQWFTGTGYLPVFRHDPIVSANEQAEAVENDAVSS